MTESSPIARVAASSRRVAAVVVAAGSGKRMGSDTPKQFLPLAGAPLLRHGVAALRRHPAIGPIAVVVDPAYRSRAEEALDGLSAGPFVAGGTERQASVRAGLEALAALPAPPETVLIHDAARPFVDNALIDRVLAAITPARGAIPALPVVDTLKRGADGLAGETVARDGLFRAQTPQGFPFEPILAAHRRLADAALTDDAALAEADGHSVALVDGREENFKVTTPDDMARAERLMLAGLGDVRTGMGYDVHRLGPGDGVWLGGVRIAHDQSLIGHSDADVALHALTDAILGAIAAGDIGQHFPPSDPQWRGADSSRFLAHAGKLVSDRGGMIAHVDLTIICERPKVGPHRAAMTARIAQILSLSPDRVGVKATTTEGLGFTGRGEGIAAQAIATVRLP
ncbi:bifunctional 2-C-methyl-D-erythritol 4-phosphate cytidylyltransferase/2-C-methyl-D-erythritol 2,4-cyclodiphosphate synthase [Zavarzinia compransoris]|uniref:bifunctional 2-C-methyl-D-erythritol 4-phosphate cytidylyltransferase/2-C-methyl-D-erythritol 2,4-cyclodiphosphate synthase n=1 Tax=Zavarzinia marina TaxID=2911065 RepID=UPI001F260047|nr:bifunctional 2-C-methyl-D-erythritol 4-phosphate cytidylyltransferase/2-C-methyl-D-erythritol 2,4-cyclodiphosphate synthase [Zavarzinia marina]MCF4164644.1 bifunctional 2-C-methyl-D-erythritol 4-phosphate cytidylyltransferase/2-C-methyl-D-erythritol 2,4-cyclodiphosphate synthase [Zavarzinia marina]